MNVVVGIFDEEHDLEIAVRHLAEHGFEDTVFEQSIIAQETGVNVMPTGTFSGSIMGQSGTFGVQLNHDRTANTQLFKGHLKDDFGLSAEIVESYATSFQHDAKFVVVRVQSDRAEEVMDILQDCKASRVNQHK